ncbi:hypothetical protein M8C21_012433, partial [Ambrosia artemisiifolia]
MASPVPAKSQPLHNFSLPHLKWKNHRGRLTGDTSSSSPPHHGQQSSPSCVSRRPSPLHKQSPMRDYSESESEPNAVVPIGKANGKTVYEKTTKSIDVSKGKRSNNNNKICIRIRKNNDAVITENQSSTPEQTETVVVPLSGAEEEESVPKTWNLRPRRPPMNHKQSTQKVGSSPLPENRYIHGSNNNNTKEALEGKYNDHSNLTVLKKHKFSISLTRDEIEEDIFSLTGSKPSRRPKKRPRTVQRQLDALFPGLWLGTITADSYKVYEGTPKIHKVFRRYGRTLCIDEFENNPSSCRYLLFTTIGVSS